jgi:hypothetical protein
MFLKQGTIKYHTKPEDAAVKILRKAQQLAKESVKTPTLLESV